MSSPPSISMRCSNFALMFFVVEQACAYPELDGDDEDAHHLRLFADGELAGCARIFKPDEQHHPRIGRVAIAPTHRGKTPWGAVDDGGDEGVRNGFPAPTN